MEFKPFVYIAGAGPSNPDYITVKTARIIKTCDVVIYDNLLDNSILNACKSSCIKLYAGKSAGSHYMKQEEINNLIIDYALKGNTVLRLKGGDPFVFGRGGEECEALKKAGIGYEVVPGVTSATAVPMSAGIPVTHRRLSRSFTVVTGHTADGNLKDSINFASLTKTGGTLVFLMGLNAINTICTELINNGMEESTPCAVISNGTRENEHSVRGTLKNISEIVKSDEKITPPSIIVVGKCASLDMRSDIRLPLCGIKTVVCGTESFCQKLSNKIVSLGGSTEVLSYVKIIPLPEKPLMEEFKNIQNYNVVVFTGPNSIRLFFEHLNNSEIDIRALSHMRFAAIGPSTKEFLKNYGIKADIMPKTYTSDALAKEIIENFQKSDRILIPRALKGNKVLGESLKNAGIKFKEIPLYDTVCQNIESMPLNANFITFASSAGVRGFFENGGNIPENTKAVCIGKYTAEELEKHGFSNFLVAKEACADGIVETILNEVKNKCSDSED